jgi:hypothetical protein
MFHRCFQSITECRLSPDIDSLTDAPGEEICAESGGITGRIVPVPATGFAQLPGFGWGGGPALTPHYSKAMASSARSVGR